MSIADEMLESLGAAKKAELTEGWTYRIRSPRRSGIGITGKAVMHFFRAGRSLCGAFSAQAIDVYREAQIQGVPHCEVCLARMGELAL